MGPHDIARVTSLSHGGCAIECACSATFVATSKDKAYLAHERHFGLEKARAALQAGGEEQA